MSTEQRRCGLFQLFAKYSYKEILSSIWSSLTDLLFKGELFDSMGCELGHVVIVCICLNDAHITSCNWARAAKDCTSKSTSGAPEDTVATPASYKQYSITSYGV